MSGFLQTRCVSSAAATSSRSAPCRRVPSRPEQPLGLSLSLVSYYDIILLCGCKGTKSQGQNKENLFLFLQTGAVRPSNSPCSMIKQGLFHSPTRASFGCFTHCHSAALWRTSRWPSPSCHRHQTWCSSRCSNSSSRSGCRRRA